MRWHEEANIYPHSTSSIKEVQERLLTRDFNALLNPDLSFWVKCIWCLMNVKGYLNPQLFHSNHLHLLPSLFWPFKNLHLTRSVGDNFVRLSWRKEKKICRIFACKSQINSKFWKCQEDQFLLFLNHDTWGRFLSGNL